MADTKTAELLMGPGNPNRPDEMSVRLELIKSVRRQRDELESEIAELLCASRELNNRLVQQANRISQVTYQRDQLEVVVGRARQILAAMHYKRYPKHKPNPLSMKNPDCHACIVLLEMERSAS